MSFFKKRLLPIFLSVLLLFSLSFPGLAANDYWAYAIYSDAFTVAVTYMTEGLLLDDLKINNTQVFTQSGVYDLVSGISSYYTVGLQLRPCFYWRGVYYDSPISSGYTSLTSFEKLADVAYTLKQAGFPCNLRSVSFVSSTGSIKSYWTIYNTAVQLDNLPFTVDFDYNSGMYYDYNMWFLSDQYGFIYVAPCDDGTSSTTTPYNYYTDGRTETVNNTTTNYYDEGDTNLSPVFKFAGDTYNQDYSSAYDYRTGDWVDTQYVDYDVDNRSYTTYVDNRSYAYYTYYITNTNITYIGNNETFDVYELYYKLPDGRSSADMTAGDLETLSLSFDVINYSKSTDDTRLRALFQFDGNTDNLSYFDAALDWRAGSSITYFDVQNFGAALYLDEAAHSFDVQLPSTLSNRDFSILFRYYHSASPQGDGLVTDLTVSCNSSQLLQIQSGESTSNVPVPIGSWSEVAIIRSGSILYFYVNGLLISSSTLSSSLNDIISFVWASGNITRQIDELRIYNYAFVDGGISYIPTSVPVDSNNILVLPDEAMPVADPYWVFNTEGNLLDAYDFTEGYNYNLLANTTSSSYQRFYPTKFRNQLSGSYLGTGYFVLNPSSLTVAASSYSPTLGYSSVQDRALNIYSPTFFLGSYEDGRFINTDDPWTSSGVPVNGDFVYTFSILLSTGELCSVTCQVSSSDYVFSSGLFHKNWSQAFDWGTLSIDFNAIGSRASTAIKFLTASVCPTSDLDIVYIELVNGTAPNSGHKHVTEIYSSLDLTRPTIAVRSSIPVNNYRLGGVRPSIPWRGDVWFLIEGGYISSCQIYTGFLWQEIDCRIWTGSRWVWPTFFNVKTMQDMTDVHGTSDDPHIQTGSGFYTWFVESWNGLISLLGEIKASISEIDSGSSIDIDLGIDVNIGDLSVDGTSSLLSVFGDLWSIFFFGEGDPAPIGSVSNDVFVNFDNFTSVFTSEQFSSGDDSDYGVFSIFTYEGDDLWE